MPSTPAGKPSGSSRRKAPTPRQAAAGGPRDGEALDEPTAAQDDAAAAGPEDPWGHLDRWDKQPGETPKVYGYFVTYRDLGRARTVKRAAEITKRGHRWLHELATLHRWVERAGAWDLEQERTFRESMVEERRAAAREHLKLTGAMLDKARERIEKLKPETMSVHDLARFVDVAVKVQRLALGESTDNVAVAADASGMVSPEAFAGMSPEAQQERLLLLRREIERRMGEAGTTGQRPSGPGAGQVVPGTVVEQPDQQPPQQPDQQS